MHWRAVYYRQVDAALSEPFTAEAVCEVVSTLLNFAVLERRGTFVEGGLLECAAMLILRLCTRIELVSLEEDPELRSAYCEEGVGDLAEEGMIGCEESTERREGGLLPLGMAEARMPELSLEGGRVGSLNPFDPLSIGLMDEELAIPLFIDPLRTILEMEELDEDSDAGDSGEWTKPGGLPRGTTWLAPILSLRLFRC